MYCGRWRCGSGLLNTVKAWMMPPKDVRHVAVGFGVCRFWICSCFGSIFPLLCLHSSPLEQECLSCAIACWKYLTFFGMVKRPFCGVREMAKLLGEYYYSYRGSEFYSQHTCHVAHSCLQHQLQGRSNVSGLCRYSTYTYHILTQMYTHTND